jgi:uncharacterized protein YukE
VIDIKPTADPGQLKQQARELDSVATELDNEARVLGIGTTGLTWRGIAADSFLSLMSDERHKLQSHANQLRAMATALRHGAAEIERYRARVARELQSQHGLPRRP